MNKSTQAISVVLPNEIGENTTRRVPAVILLDTSLSMEGAKLDQLNAGFEAFIADLQSDTKASVSIEPLIVPFADTFDMSQGWKTADDLVAQKFTTSGGTSLCQALIGALDALEDRKRMLRASGIDYLRPWVFLITDGEPTDPEYLDEAMRRAKEAEEMHKASIFCVGVEGADMNLLKQLSPARSPIELKASKFKDLFLFVSASFKTLTRTTAGHQVTVPIENDWETVS